jgi:hypothetical protein
MSRREHKATKTCTKSSRDDRQIAWAHAHTSRQTQGMSLMFGFFYMSKIRHGPCSRGFGPWVMISSSVLLTWSTWMFSTYICQLLDGKVGVLGRVSHLCTFKPGVLDLIHTKSYANLPLAARCIRQVLKFRMGCHGLPRDSGSWTSVPHQERVRRFCGVGSLGDEKHPVLECAHLQPIRDKFPGLFQP